MSGILGFAIVFVWIAISATAMSFTLSDDLGQILPQVNADRTAYLVVKWLSVGSNMLGIIFALGLYVALRRGATCCGSQC